MYQRILVPIDGSDTSELGLQEAIRMAQLTHGCLRLIHVIDDLSFALAVGTDGYYAGELLEAMTKSGQEMLAAALEKATAQGVEADTVLRDDLTRTVREHVVNEAVNWKADLIVIGTHGRRGVRRMLLGSSAEGILRTATVPVLLVRSPDHTPT